MRVRTLSSLILLFCSACGAPGALDSTSLQPVQQAQQGALSAPAKEREQVDRLAARLDLLRLLRSDLDATTYPDPDRARTTWEVSLREFDQRLLDFVVGHPELHPKSAARLRATVVEPYQALRRVDRPRGGLRRSGGN